jgi:hypothetical protein
MIKNKHCNYYIIYPDDEHIDHEDWLSADCFINGFERFFDLTEAKSRAVICAKSTRVPFLIEPRNFASIDGDSMVSCYTVSPSMNSARQV